MIQSWAAHWRDWVLLFILALAVRLASALPVSQPGYMDAYYYTAGGQQLASGQGFQEAFIWNYLDDPSGPPHPSHQYWMPLASILAAGGLWIAGSSFRAAQIPFILMASLLPLIAYGVAWQTSASRRHAWAAGLLLIFSGYFFPFWIVPETFTPFALAGALALWAAGQRPVRDTWLLLAGVCAGAAHLTRADGVLILLPLALVTIANNGTIAHWARRLAWVGLGYSLVMGPWLIHNALTTGHLLSVAGTKTIFLTNYDDLYSFGKRLDLSTYLAWGPGNILRSKLDGLWMNLLTLIAVDGFVFLTPLVVVGLVVLLRQDLRRGQGRAFVYWPVVVYIVALYLVMSVVFTFPGVRGGLFHSSAAILPFLFASGLVGLDRAVEWVAAHRPGWRTGPARQVFTWGLVGLAVLISLSIYPARTRAWVGVDSVYGAVGHDTQAEQGIVMVNNPPGYYYHTGQSAIAIPNGDVETLLTVARRYHARWLVLDVNRPAALAGLYADPDSDSRLQLVNTWPGNNGRPVYVFRVKLQDLEDS